MPLSLDDVLTAKRVDETTDALDVAAGFGQGKATFGGLVIGACVRSMTSRVNDPSRRLRSVTAQLVGAPAPGPAVIRMRLLRATMSVATWSADLEQDGRVMTHVVGVFAANRPVDLEWNTLSAPKTPHWKDVERLDTDNPFAPEFTKNFEFRSVGPLPFSGSKEMPLGFIRPAAPSKIRDAGYVTCLIDAWWLSAFARFDELRPAATLTYSAELFSPIDDLDPEAPLLHVGDAIAAKDGYSIESRRLFGIDGRLVSTNTQLVAIIK